MIRKQFLDIINRTGMIPFTDLRGIIANKDKDIISELEILKLSFFDPEKFAKQLAPTYALVYINLLNAKVSDKTLGLLKKSDIIKYRAIPVQHADSLVTLAIYDPSITQMKAALQAQIKLPIEFIFTDLKSWASLFVKVRASIDELVSTIKEMETEDESTAASGKEEDIGQDVIEYVNKIIATAIYLNASDIHIEPYESVFRIRYRVDGELTEGETPGMQYKLPIISRVKIMAQLDISEKRKPQDGRIKIQIDSKTIDFRVSSLPTLFGEKVVLRILDKSNLQLDMTNLGFEQKQLTSFKNGYNRPFGMCLVTGPTGSGKTTTLYSVLADLNKIDSNISTAEDPVEFNLEGINQVNVRKDIGFTFATALKAFLRQDPDIVMVGEIRDAETGEIAIEAALTGHMVLSTLHTNDAASTITRLLNMGIEPFLVSGSLNVVVAQRLCRRICTNCKEEHQVSAAELISCGFAENSASKIKVYRGKGCEFCGGTGYKGRVAIYEVLEITPPIREIIIKSGISDEIKKVAIASGMKTLRMSALTKVAKGLTTLEEAVTNSAADKI